MNYFLESFHDVQIKGKALFLITCRLGHREIILRCLSWFVVSRQELRKSIFVYTGYNSLNQTVKYSISKKKVIL